jgi:hypothetical protein
MAANSLFGLPGSVARSAAPVRGSTYSTFLQVLPPSVVLNTPRSAFSPHAWPMAATQATFGSVGWRTMR